MVNTFIVFTVLAGLCCAHAEKAMDTVEARGLKLISTLSSGSTLSSTLSSGSRDIREPCNTGETYDAVAKTCVPVSCEAVDACARGKTCVFRSRDCLRSPCPQFDCICGEGEEYDAVTEICQPVSCDASRACDRGETCVFASRDCLRSPCPQFDCVTCGKGEDYDPYTEQCEPVTCASPRACASGERCGFATRFCARAPCPQFTCDPCPAVDCPAPPAGCHYEVPPKVPTAHPTWYVTATVTSAPAAVMPGGVVDPKIGDTVLPPKDFVPKDGVLPPKDFGDGVTDPSPEEMGGSMMMPPGRRTATLGSSISSTLSSGATLSGTLSSSDIIRGPSGFVPITPVLFPALTTVPSPEPSRACVVCTLAMPMCPAGCTSCEILKQTCHACAKAVCNDDDGCPDADAACGKLVCDTPVETCDKGEKFNHDARRCVPVTCDSPRACADGDTCAPAKSRPCPSGGAPCPKYYCEKPCPEGEAYHDHERACVPVSCDSKRACASDETCVKAGATTCDASGACTSFKCAKKCDAGKAYDFAEKACVPVSCEADDACTSGETCMETPGTVTCSKSMVCSAFQCVKPCEMGKEYDMAQKRCVAVSCAAADACPSGARCWPKVGAYCKPGRTCSMFTCREDKECPKGQEYDAEQQACVKVSCDAVDACNSGSTCREGGAAICAYGATVPCQKFYCQKCPMPMCAAIGDVPGCHTTFSKEVHEDGVWKGCWKYPCGKTVCDLPTSIPTAEPTKPITAAPTEPISTASPTVHEEEEDDLPCVCTDYRNGAGPSSDRLCMGPKESCGCVKNKAGDCGHCTEDLGNVHPCYPLPKEGCNRDWVRSDGAGVCTRAEENECVDVPTVTAMAPATGHVGDTVVLSGTWRKGPGMNARCFWWFENKAYNMYQKATLDADGNIACTVPARLTGMADNADDIRVSVQVWKTGFEAGKQRNICFSHNGHAPKNEGEFGSFAYDVGCVDNPVIEAVSPASGHVGDFVELVGTWRTGTDVHVRCNWWFNGKAYKLYQPGEMAAHGGIMCPVPARGPGMGDDAAARITVQVWKAAAEAGKQKNACFSHNGQVPKTPGQFVEFAYKKLSCPAFDCAKPAPGCFYASAGVDEKGCTAGCGELECPCMIVDCKLGDELVGADERGCGGKCEKKPCAMVACAPGEELVGADDRGCGGKCEEEKPCLMVDCAPGWAKTGEDDRGCGGKCVEDVACPADTPYCASVALTDHTCANYYGVDGRYCQRDPEKCCLTTCGCSEEKPCVMVDCAPGWSKTGEDDRGCGGKCVEDVETGACPADTPYCASVALTDHTCANYYGVDGRYCQRDPEKCCLTTCGCSDEVPTIPDGPIFVSDLTVTRADDHGKLHVEWQNGDDFRHIEKRPDLASEDYATAYPIEYRTFYRMKDCETGEWGAWKPKNDRHGGGELQSADTAFNGDGFVGVIQLRVVPRVKASGGFTPDAIDGAVVSEPIAIPTEADACAPDTPCVLCTEAVPQCDASCTGACKIVDGTCETCAAAHCEDGFERPIFVHDFKVTRMDDDGAGVAVMMEWVNGADYRHIEKRPDLANEDYEAAYPIEYRTFYRMKDCETGKWGEWKPRNDRHGGGELQAAETTFKGDEFVGQIQIKIVPRVKAAGGFTSEATDGAPESGIIELRPCPADISICEVIECARGHMVEGADENGCGGTCVPRCKAGHTWYDATQSCDCPPPPPCAMLSIDACPCGRMGHDETNEHGCPKFPCGGPCKTPCSTCHDGLQGEDEAGIDCGGSCARECALVPPTSDECPSVLTAGAFGKEVLTSCGIMEPTALVSIGDPNSLRPFICETSSGISKQCSANLASLSAIFQECTCPTGDAICMVVQDLINQSFTTATCGAIREELIAAGCAEDTVPCDGGTKPPTPSMVCPADAKECPGAAGVYVSRNPADNCDWHKCPIVTTDCDCTEYRNGAAASDLALCMGPTETTYVDTVTGESAISMPKGRRLSMIAGRPCYPLREDGTCHNSDSDWAYCVQPANPSCGKGEERDEKTKKCVPVMCDSPRACAGAGEVCHPVDAQCVRAPCPQFECTLCPAISCYMPDGCFPVAGGGTGKSGCPSCPEIACPCDEGEEYDSIAESCVPVQCDAAGACPSDSVCTPADATCMRAPCPQFLCDGVVTLPPTPPFVQCPKPVCAEPDEGCSYILSPQVLGDDGCPMHPCGVMSCTTTATACPVPACAPPRPGCHSAHSEEVGEDGCPLYPCGVETCSTLPPTPAALSSCMDAKACGKKCQMRWISIPPTATWDAMPPATKGRRTLSIISNKDIISNNLDIMAWPQGVCQPDGSCTENEEPNCGGGVCCEARTAPCLACKVGATLEEFCRREPSTEGCKSIMCPQVKCAKPRPGCRFVASDELAEDGVCPKYPCGLEACSNPEDEVDDHTCATCLADGKAWAAGRCHPMCPMDVACYELREGPRDGKAIARECRRAEADAADAKLCGAQASCGACVAAEPTTSACHWFGPAGRDPATDPAGGGWCGHGCGMMGCGATTCGAPKDPCETLECGDVCSTAKDGMVGIAAMQYCQRDGTCGMAAPECGEPKEECDIGETKKGEGANWCNTCTCQRSNGGRSMWACTEKACGNPGGECKDGDEQEGDGANWCNTCKCRNGRWSCTTKKCPAPCKVVDCKVGYKLVGADDRGCGGACKKKPACGQDSCGKYEKCVPIEEDEEEPPTYTTKGRQLQDLSTVHFLADMGDTSLSKDLLYGGVPPSDEVGSIGDTLKCTVCKKVIGKLEEEIIKHGCGWITKLEGAAACEAIGLGPEDPAADICVGLIVAGCPELLKLINEGIKGADKLCNLVGFCPSASVADTAFGGSDMWTTGVAMPGAGLDNGVDFGSALAGAVGDGMLDALKGPEAMAGLDAMLEVCPELRDEINAVKEAMQGATSAADLTKLPQFSIPSDCAKRMAGGVRVDGPEPFPITPGSDGMMDTLMSADGLKDTLALVEAMLDDDLKQSIAPVQSDWDELMAAVEAGEDAAIKELLCGNERLADVLAKVLMKASMKLMESMESMAGAMPGGVVPGGDVTNPEGCASFETPCVSICADPARTCVFTGVGESMTSACGCGAATEDGPPREGDGEGGFGWVLPIHENLGMETIDLGRRLQDLSSMGGADIGAMITAGLKMMCYDIGDGTPPPARDNIAEACEKPGLACMEACAPARGCADNPEHPNCMGYLPCSILAQLGGDGPGSDTRPDDTRGAAVRTTINKYCCAFDDGSDINMHCPPVEGTGQTWTPDACCALRFPGTTAGSSVGSSDSTTIVSQCAPKPDTVRTTKNKYCCAFDDGSDINAHCPPVEGTGQTWTPDACCALRFPGTTAASSIGSSDSTTVVSQCAPEDKPRMCCRAMTATCLACAAGMTEEDYCRAHQDTMGCEQFVETCHCLISGCTGLFDGANGRSAVVPKYMCKKSGGVAPGTCDASCAEERGWCESIFDNDAATTELKTFELFQAEKHCGEFASTAACERQTTCRWTGPRREEKLYVCVPDVPSCPAGKKFDTKVHKCVVVSCEAKDACKKHEVCTDVRAVHDEDYPLTTFVNSCKRGTIMCPNVPGLCAATLSECYGSNVRCRTNCAGAEARTCLSKCTDCLPCFGETNDARVCATSECKMCSTKCSDYAPCFPPPPPPSVECDSEEALQCVDECAECERCAPDQQFVALIDMMRDDPDLAAELDRPEIQDVVDRVKAGVSDFSTTIAHSADIAAAFTDLGTKFVAKMGSDLAGIIDPIHAGAGAAQPQPCAIADLQGVVDAMGRAPCPSGKSTERATVGGVMGTLPAANAYGDQLWDNWGAWGTQEEARGITKASGTLATDVGGIVGITEPLWATGGMGGAGIGRRLQGLTTGNVGSMSGLKDTLRTVVMNEGNVAPLTPFEGSAIPWSTTMQPGSGSASDWTSATLQISDHLDSSQPHFDTQSLLSAFVPLLPTSGTSVSSVLDIFTGTCDAGIMCPNAAGRCAPRLADCFTDPGESHCDMCEKTCSRCEKYRACVPKPPAACARQKHCLGLVDGWGGQCPRACADWLCEGDGAECLAWELEHKDHSMPGFGAFDSAVWGNFKERCGCRRGPVIGFPPPRIPQTGGPLLAPTDPASSVPPAPEGLAKTCRTPSQECKKACTPAMPCNPEDGGDPTRGNCPGFSPCMVLLADPHVLIWTEVLHSAADAADADVARVAEDLHTFVAETVRARDALEASGDVHDRLKDVRDHVNAIGERILGESAQDALKDEDVVALLEKAQSVVNDLRLPVLWPYYEDRVKDVIRSAGDGLKRLANLRRKWDAQNAADAVTDEDDKKALTGVSDVLADVAIGSGMGFSHGDAVRAAREALEERIASASAGAKEALEKGLNALDDVQSNIDAAVKETKDKIDEAKDKLGDLFSTAGEAAAKALAEKKQQATLAAAKKAKEKAEAAALAKREADAAERAAATKEAKEAALKKRKAAEAAAAEAAKEAAKVAREKKAQAAAEAKASAAARARARLGNGVITIAAGMQTYLGTAGAAFEAIKGSAAKQASANVNAVLGKFGSWFAEKASDANNTGWDLTTLPKSILDDMREAEADLAAEIDAASDEDKAALLEAKAGLEQVTKPVEEGLKKVQEETKVAAGQWKTIVEKGSDVADKLGEEVQEKLAGLHDFMDNAADKVNALASAEAKEAAQRANRLLEEGAKWITERADALKGQAGATIDMLTVPIDIIDALEKAGHDIRIVLGDKYLSNEDKARLVDVKKEMDKFSDLVREKQQQAAAAAAAARKKYEAAHFGAAKLSDDVQKAMTNAAGWLKKSAKEFNKIADTESKEAVVEATKAMENVGDLIGLSKGKLGAIPAAEKNRIDEAYAKLEAKIEAAKAAKDEKTQAVLEQAKDGLEPLKEQIEDAAAKAKAKMDAAKEKWQESMDKSADKLGDAYIKLNNVKDYMATAATKFSNIVNGTVKAAVSDANEILEQAGEFIADNQDDLSFDTVDSAMTEDLTEKLKSMRDRIKEMKDASKPEFLEDLATLEAAKDRLQDFHDTVKAAVKKNEEKVEADAAKLLEQMKEKAKLLEKSGMDKKMTSHLNAFAGGAAAINKHLASEQAKKASKAVNAALTDITAFIAQGSDASLSAISNDKFGEMMDAADAAKQAAEETRAKIKAADARGDLLRKQRLLEERAALKKAEAGAKAMKAALERARKIMREKIEDARESWDKLKVDAAKDGGDVKKLLEEAKGLTLGLLDKLRDKLDDLADGSARQTMEAVTEALARVARFLHRAADVARLDALPLTAIDPVVAAIAGTAVADGSVEQDVVDSAKAAMAKLAEARRKALAAKVAAAKAAREKAAAAAAKAAREREAAAAAAAQAKQEAEEAAARAAAKAATAAEKAAALAKQQAADAAARAEEHKREMQIRILTVQTYIKEKADAHDAAGGDDLNAGLEDEGARDAVVEVDVAIEQAMATSGGDASTDLDVGLANLDEAVVAQVDAAFLKVKGRLDGLKKREDAMTSAQKLAHQNEKRELEKAMAGIESMRESIADAEVEEGKWKANVNKVVDMAKAEWKDMKEKSKDMFAKQSEASKLETIADKVNDGLAKAAEKMDVLDDKAAKQAKIALSEAQKALERVGAHMKTHDDVDSLSDEDAERVKLAHAKLQAQIDAATDADVKAPLATVLDAIQHIKDRRDAAWTPPADLSRTCAVGTGGLACLNACRLPIARCFRGANAANVLSECAQPEWEQCRAFAEQVVPPPPRGLAFRCRPDADGNVDAGCAAACGRVGAMCLQSEKNAYKLAGCGEWLDHCKTLRPVTKLASPPAFLERLCATPNSGCRTACTPARICLVDRSTAGCNEWKACSVLLEREDEVFTDDGTVAQDEEAQDEEEAGAEAGTEAGATPTDETDALPDLVLEDTATTEDEVREACETPSMACATRCALATLRCHFWKPDCEPFGAGDKSRALVCRKYEACTTLPTVMAQVNLMCKKNDFSRPKCPRNDDTGEECSAHGHCPFDRRHKGSQCKCDDGYVGRTCQRAKGDLDDQKIKEVKEALVDAFDAKRDLLAQFVATCHANGDKAGAVLNSTVALTTRAARMMCPKGSKHEMACVHALKECFTDPEKPEEEDTMADQLRKKAESCTDEEVFCGLRCIPRKVGCLATLPQLRPCLNTKDGKQQRRCLDGMCMPADKACEGEGSTEDEKQAAVEKLCPDPEQRVPCGDGLTCARSAKECGLTVPRNGPPQDKVACAAAPNLYVAASLSAAKRAARCASLTGCPEGFVVCGRQRTNGMAEEEALPAELLEDLEAEAEELAFAEVVEPVPPPPSDLDETCRDDNPECRQACQPLDDCEEGVGTNCNRYTACDVLVAARRRRLRGPRAWARARRRRLSSPKRLPGRRAKWKIDLVKKAIPTRRLRPWCVPIADCPLGKGRPAKVAPQKKAVDPAFEATVDVPADEDPSVNLVKITIPAGTMTNQEAPEEPFHLTVNSVADSVLEASPAIKTFTSEGKLATQVVSISIDKPELVVGGEGVQVDLLVSDGQAHTDAQACADVVANMFVYSLQDVKGDPLKTADQREGFEVLENAVDKLTAESNLRKEARCGALFEGGACRCRYYANHFSDVFAADGAATTSAPTASPTDSTWEPTTSPTAAPATEAGSETAAPATEAPATAAPETAAPATEAPATAAPATATPATAAPETEQETAAPETEQEATDPHAAVESLVVTTAFTIEADVEPTTANLRTAIATAAGVLEKYVTSVTVTKARRARAVRRLNSDTFAVTATIDMGKGKGLTDPGEAVAQVESSITTGLKDALMDEGVTITSNPTLKMTGAVSPPATGATPAPSAVLAPSPADEKEAEEGLSTGALAGIIAGSVLGAAMIAVFACRNRNKHGHSEEETHRAYSRRPSSRSLKLDGKGDMSMQANPMAGGGPAEKARPLSMTPRQTSQKSMAVVRGGRPQRPNRTHTIEADDPAFQQADELGWNKYTSQDGRPYWVNKVTKKSQWEDPHVNPMRRPARRSVIAAGWKEHVDPKSKRKYYVNASTGETSWTKPTAQLSRVMTGLTQI